MKKELNSQTQTPDVRDEGVTKILGHIKDLESPIQLTGPVQLLPINPPTHSIIDSIDMPDEGLSENQQILKKLESLNESFDQMKSEIREILKRVNESKI